MGSGSDFFKGAAVGILGTMKQGYDERNEEAALAEQRAYNEQQRIAAEERAAARQKQAEIWRADKQRTFTQLDANMEFIDDESRREEINQKYGQSFSNLEEAETYARSKISADVEIDKQEELRRRGLGRYEAGGAQEKGLTAADARAALTDAVTDITGVDEKSAGADPSSGRPSQLARFAKKEEQENVLEILVGEDLRDDDGGFGLWNKDRSKGISRDRNELRDELIWTMARTERSNLNKEAKNNVLEPEHVYARASEVVERADAGLSEVQQGILMLRKTGVPEGKSIEDVLEYERARLYESMGYSTTDPTALAAKKLWAIYENGLRAVGQ